MPQLNTPLPCIHHSKNIIKICTALECTSRLYCNDCLVEQAPRISIHASDLVDCDDFLSCQETEKFNQIISVILQKKRFLDAVYEKAKHAENFETRNIEQLLWSIKEKMLSLIEECIDKVGKLMVSELKARNKPVFEFLEDSSNFLSASIDTIRDNKINNKICYHYDKTSKETIIENLIQDGHTIISSLKASDQYKSLDKFVDKYFADVEFRELSLRTVDTPSDTELNLNQKSLHFMHSFSTKLLDNEINVRLEHFLQTLNDKILTSDRITVKDDISMTITKDTKCMINKFDDLQVMRLSTLTVRNTEDLNLVTSASMRYEVSKLELHLNSKINDRSVFGAYINKFTGRVEVKDELYIDLRYNTLPDDIISDILDFLIVGTRHVKTLTLLLAGTCVTSAIEPGLISTIKGFKSLESLTLDLKDLKLTKTFYKELEKMVISMKSIDKVCLTLCKSGNAHMVKHLTKVLKGAGVIECKVYL